MVARASAVAALALVLAGCGGGGSSGGQDALEYAREAERVCVQGNEDAFDLDEQVRKAQQQEDPSEVYEDLAALTRRSARTAEPYLDRLDALPRPDEDDAKLAQWIADQRRRLAMLEDLAKAFDTQDDRAVAAASKRLGDLEDRLSAFAKDYGMRECAAT